MVPTLGQILIAQGALTQAALETALVEQRRRQAAGEWMLLGKLLVEMRLITSAQLEQAVLERDLRRASPAATIRQAGRHGRQG